MKCISITSRVKYYMGLLRGMRDGQNYQVKLCPLSPRTDLAIYLFNYPHVTAMEECSPGTPYHPPQSTWIEIVAIL